MKYTSSNSTIIIMTLFQNHLFRHTSPLLYSCCSSVVIQFCFPNGYSHVYKVAVGSKKNLIWNCGCALCTPVTRYVIYSIAFMQIAWHWPKTKHFFNLIQNWGLLFAVLFLQNTIITVNVSLPKLELSLLACTIFCIFKLGLGNIFITEEICQEPWG